MKTYSKAQFSWFLQAFFIPLLVFLLLAYQYQWGNSPMNQSSYSIISNNIWLLYFVWTQL